MNLEAVKALVGGWEETEVDGISKKDVAIEELRERDEEEDVVQMAGATELEVVEDVADEHIPVDVEALADKSDSEIKEYQMECWYGKLDLELHQG